MVRVARRTSPIVVFVLGMAALFGLLSISDATETVSPNSPRIVPSPAGPSLSLSCLGPEQYETLSGTNGVMLGLPSYVPEGYSLECINMRGPTLPDLSSVSLYYYKDDEDFRSRFLPKIEEGTENPLTAKWTSEFTEAGGILIFQSVEYIEENDPRYNDKVKHFEIDKALGDPLNECPINVFINANCEFQAEYPPIEFANGNPIAPTFTIHDGGKMNGLLMYMDNNWLVYIFGIVESDELFKIAETIRQSSQQ